MTTTINGYTDAFAATPWNTPSEESISNKLVRKYRRLKKENKELKRTIKEQRDAEEKRVAEQRVAEGSQKKERSLWERIGDAIEKAIPAICVAIASFFVRKYFSPKKECKCA